MHNTYRLGDSGPEVRDVQRRLADLGYAVDDSPGRFDESTADAVRAFQQERGLFADGTVGPDTWRALVEAAWKLGDRVLYQTRPMLRGDDVRELQERLDRIGLEVGGADGILGPETRAAIVEFQLMQGLKADGQAGSTTIATLSRVGRDHQSIAASEVLERHRMGRRRPLRTLAGASIVLDPGNSHEVPGYDNPDGIAEHEVTWAIASRFHGRLAALGARPVLARGPTNSPTPSERAALANREDADVVVSLQTNGLDSRFAHGVAGYYFGTGDTVSVAGRTLSDGLVAAVAAAAPTLNCRSHPSTATLLRESRAVTVAIELGFLTHPHEGRRLVEPVHQARLVEAMLSGLRDWMLGRPPSRIGPSPTDPFRTDPSGTGLPD